MPARGKREKCPARARGERTIGREELADMQVATRARFAAEFHQIAAPEIARLKKVISSSSGSLRTRIPGVASALREFLLKHGVTAKQRIKVQGWAGEVQLGKWLTRELRGEIISAIEREMKKRHQAAERAAQKDRHPDIGWVWKNADFGMGEEVNSEKIAYNYVGAVNDRNPVGELRLWRSDVSSTVDYFLRKEMEKEK